MSTSTKNRIRSLIKKVKEIELELNSLIIDLDEEYSKEHEIEDEFQTYPTVKEQYESEDLDINNNVDEIDFNQHAQIEEIPKYILLDSNKMEISNDNYSPKNLLEKTCFVVFLQNGEFISKEKFDVNIVINESIIRDIINYWKTMNPLLANKYKKTVVSMSECYLKAEEINELDIITNNIAKKENITLIIEQ